MTLENTVKEITIVLGRDVLILQELWVASRREGGILGIFARCYFKGYYKLIDGYISEIKHTFLQNDVKSIDHPF